MFYEQSGGIKASLRHFTKSVAGAFSSILPFKSWLSWSKQGVFLPFYHIVSDMDCPYVDHLYKKRSTAIFEADLDYLLKYYQAIDLDTLIAIVEGQMALPNKPVMHLSFDDGLKECAEVIAPILLRKGIPATFFLNSDFIDNQGLMFRYKLSLIAHQVIAMPEKERESYLRPKLLSMGLKVNSGSMLEILFRLGYKHIELIDRIAVLLGIDVKAVLQAHRPYMTTKQIDHLLAKGFTIGSHSVDHPMYKKLDLEQQIAQTIEGQRILEEQFELDYRVFAFPFTDDGVKAEFFTEIFEQGEFDLCFGGAGLKKDTIKKNLQRFPMESQGLPSAAKMLKREYAYYQFKSLIGKNKIERL